MTLVFAMSECQKACVTRRWQTPDELRSMWLSPKNSTPPDQQIRRRGVYPFGISCEGFTFLLWKPRQASINYT